MLVVVVQHGEKEPLPGDQDLTDLGRRQALAAADALVGLRPGIVVSSPLLRAQQTAEPLCTALGVAACIDTGLLERTNLKPGTEPDQFLSDCVRTTRIGLGSRPADGARSLPLPRCSERFPSTRSTSARSSCSVTADPPSTYYAPCSATPGSNVVVLAVSPLARRVEV